MVVVALPKGVAFLMTKRAKALRSRAETKKTTTMTIARRSPVVAAVYNSLPQITIPTPEPSSKNVSYFLNAVKVC
ncbi:hypothetical protein L596_006425 [Steinernema carpocapsae]|uniref:Uncharacterized protein n=1 Tax=Steinernema carpocapsae TaxID=34508 RepID=A0A4U8V499_STECR|nr:hypothetical protein L596_006425 [Steinernema carpocapsae]